VAWLRGQDLAESGIRHGYDLIRLDLYRQWLLVVAMLGGIWSEVSVGWVKRRRGTCLTLLIPERVSSIGAICRPSSLIVSRPTLYRHQPDL